MITPAGGGQDPWIYVPLVLHMVEMGAARKKVKELLPKDGKEILNSR